VARKNKDSKDSVETTDTDATDHVVPESGETDNGSEEATTDAESSDSDDKKPTKDRLSAFLASELMGKIKKKHGGSILMRASDFKVQQRPRISTGIFPLDYALGGGLPVGLVSTLYGQKSASKTTTFLKTIANAQKMCSDCHLYRVDEVWGCRCKKPRDFVITYMDVEGTLDMPWVQALGVDTSKLFVSVPEYAEQTLDIAEAIVRSGECDILVLDSIAFLTPQKEIEESIEKDQMGIASRIIGRGIRKFTAAVNGVGNETGRRPTIFFTNQIRMKIGVMYGSPEVQSGGQAPGYAAAVEVKVSQGKYEMDEISKKPVTVEINFRVEKNKTSGSKMEGSYKMFVTDAGDRKIGDIEDELQMVDWAENVGIVHRSGGYQCLGETFRIKDDLVKRLIKDRALKAKLWHAVMPLLLAS
jgi:recombination protein RecA